MASHKELMYQGLVGRHPDKTIRVLEMIEIQVLGIGNWELVIGNWLSLNLTYF
jgi:hypothetical protein